MDIAKRIAEILEAVRNGSMSQADADAAIALLRQQDPAAVASAMQPGLSPSQQAGWSKIRSAISSGRKKYLAEQGTPARSPLADLLDGTTDARTLRDVPANTTAVDIPGRQVRPVETLREFFADMPPRTEVDIPTRVGRIPTPPPVPSEFTGQGSLTGELDAAFGRSFDRPPKRTPMPMAESSAAQATVESMGDAMPRAGGSALRRALGAVGKKLPYIGGALGVADAMFSDKPVPLALFDMIVGEPNTLSPGTLPPRVDAPMFDPSSPTSQTPVKPSAVRDFNVVAGVQPKRDSAASFSPSLRDMIMGGGAPMTVEPSVPEFDPRSAMMATAKNEVPDMTELDMPTVADVDFPEYAAGIGKYEGRSASTGGPLSSEAKLDALLARLKLLQAEQPVSPLRQKMSPRESFRDFYSGGGLQ